MNRRLIAVLVGLAFLAGFFLFSRPPSDRESCDKLDGTLTMWVAGSDAVMNPYTPDMQPTVLRLNETYCMRNDPPATNADGKAVVIVLATYPEEN